jgi:hypothetical protein
MVGSYKLSSEISGYAEKGEFFHELRNYKLVKHDEIYGIMFFRLCNKPDAHI